MIHRHSTHWREGDPSGCLTVCGLDCGTRGEIIYSGGPDSEVTCPTCLSGMTGTRYYVVRNA